ncbi:MAG: DUF1838 domain-containing protein [Alphaproteobacteria bacterium]|nr:DUF1838 domain-containing protein [Alphaproteobacteria bacterium]
MRRRNLLTTAALAPAIIGTSTAWGAELKLDVNNPEHQFLIHRKLAYAMTGDVTYWMLVGIRYGHVEHKMVPLWQMNVASWFTAKDLDGGAYEVTQMNATFYTDPKTGAFLESFTNPFNGKSYKIPYVAPAARKQVHKPGHGEDRPPRPGYKLEPTSERVAGIDGGDVWIRADNFTRMTPDDSTKGYTQIHDLSTYFGALKDVANTDNKNPAARWAFNDLNTFPDYMEMGPKGGMFFSRALGHKIFRYQDMPALWRDLMDKRYPAIARDPAGALKG